MSFTGTIQKVLSGQTMLLGGLAIEKGSVQLAQRDLGAGESVQGTGTAQDTSIVLPAGTVVENIVLDVETAEATGTTQTVDIGHAGDGAAYASGLDVSATGLKVDGALGVADQERTVTITAGSNDFADLVATLIVEYRIVT